MIELIEPWFSVEINEKEGFEKEFRKERPKSHILNGKELDLIGRRYGQDDILFLITGTSKPAVVHLTWTGKKETGIWPSAFYQF